MLQPITIKKRALNQNLSTLRNKEMIPGILYGQSLKQSIPIQIPSTHLYSIINNPSNSTIFPLNLEGETCNCILRDFQTDPLYSGVIHVDFQVVKKGEVVKMNIPVTYEGLEHLRGKKLILEKSIDKICVRGPVDSLPETFTLNIGNLEHGSKIFAGDIELPSKTEMLIRPDTIIATVQ